MLHPATSLDDVYKTLFPEPLLTPEQVRAFYSDRLNAVRGDDKVARLALALNRAFGGNYYKAFLMGHPGVGKSTELTRLIQRMDDKYCAIRSVLEARIVPGLFEEGQMMRLIVASGGNLRDLFSLVTQAADNALLRQPPGKKIDRSDTDSAIDNLRTEYTPRLGDSPYDKDQIPYESKAARLVAIYNSDPNARIPDAVLHSLLRSRAVQEFNGKGWFGVHPLVVDILQSSGSHSPHCTGWNRLTLMP